MYQLFMSTLHVILNYNDHKCIDIPVSQFIEQVGSMTKGIPNKIINFIVPLSYKVLASTDTCQQANLYKLSSSEQIIACMLMDAYELVFIG